MLLLLSGSLYRQAVRKERSESRAIDEEVRSCEAARSKITEMKIFPEKAAVENKPKKKRRLISQLRASSTADG